MVNLEVWIKKIQKYKKVITPLGFVIGAVFFYYSTTVWACNNVASILLAMAGVAAVLRGSLLSIAK